MITIVKRKDRSLHAGYRHTLKDIELYIENEVDFQIVEARSGEDITQSVLINLLHKKESDTGNTELLNRCVIGGGFTSYLKLLNTMREL